MLDEPTITYATAQPTDATVCLFASSLCVQTPGERVATVVTVVSDLAAHTRLLPRPDDRQDADPGKVDELLALVDASKACTHQQAEGSELLCLAASSKDETALGTTGSHRVVPTFRPLCWLPDARRRGGVFAVQEDRQQLAFRL